MAKYCYTTASDVPVRLEMTVYEMRTLCRILRGAIARKDADRYLAQDLHETLLGSIKNAAGSMAVEANYLTAHATEDMVDQLNDAISQSQTVETGV